MLFRSRNNSWLYSRLLLVAHKEDELHFGIGLEKVKKLFKDKAAVCIEQDRALGLFRVKLPGLKNEEESNESR